MSTPYEVFHQDVGTWEAEIVVRQGPIAAEQRSRGKMTCRLVCGGKWLISEFKTEDSDFEGHGVYGWDPARSKYVATWVDTMRTFLTVGEGDWDAEAQTMTFRYEAELPGRTLRWREVTNKKNPSEYIFRSYMPDEDGEEFEMMTVTYRKV
jgi:hypothetical protein